MPLQTNNLGILFSQQESPSDTNTHLTAIIRLTYTVNSDVPSSIRHPELPPPRSLAGANNSKSLPVSRDAIHLLSPPPPPGIIGLGKEGPIHKLSSSCVAMVTSSSTNEYVLSKVRPTDTCVPKTTGCVALLCDWVRCGTCQFPYPGLSFPLTLCCRGRGIRCAMVPKMQTVSWADDFRVHLVEGHASSTFALSHYTNQQFVDVED